MGALIEVKANRQGRNQLPGLPTWKARYKPALWPRPEGRKNLKMYRHDTTLGTLEPRAKVYKYGAASGLTLGHYQGVESHVGPSMKNADPSGASTNAYLIESFGTRPFCVPGDSGAVVYDAEGHALGMIFSKIHPKTAKKIHGGYLTWVMPMDQIFADIERFCGVTDLRISPPIDSPPDLIWGEERMKRRGGGRRGGERGGGGRQGRRRGGGRRG